MTWWKKELQPTVSKKNHLTFEKKMQNLFQCYILFCCCSFHSNILCCINNIRFWMDFCFSLKQNKFENFFRPIQTSKESTIITWFSVFQTHLLIKMSWGLSGVGERKRERETPLSEWVSADITSDSGPETFLDTKQTIIAIYLLFMFSLHFDNKMIAFLSFLWWVFCLCMFVFIRPIYFK